MTAPIDFYFDFSSPYGYFASTRIDELAQKYGRGVLWHRSEEHTSELQSH